MEDPRIETTSPPADTGRWLERWLFAAVSAALLLKLHLVFLLNVNWDEYHYLSYVWEHAQGTLTNPWQTFHVHLFAWLVHVPGDELFQIFIARLVLWGLAVVGAFLIYGLARRVLSRPAALLAVLSSLSFSYLIEHGTSFRPDTLSAPFFLGGLYLLLARDSVRSAVAAGLLLAIACMVTIKSVLFVGLGGVILLLRWWGNRRERPRLRQLFRQAGAGSLAFAGCLGVLWLWHRWGLMPVPELAPTGRYLSSSASKVFFADGFFPRWHYLQRTLERDALGWLLLLAGAVVAGRQVLRGRREERSRGLLLLAFSLPLLTLALYRNAFPYFYVFVLPPACLLAGLTAESLAMAAQRRSPRAAGLLTVLLVVGLGAQTGTHYLRQDQDQNRQQKTLLATIHRMFPEPVPYIDRCSMVASFPKVGFFMSSWGMETYQAAGRAAIAEVVREDQPPFLVANVPALWFFLPDREYSRLRLSLLPEDRAALRDNYIQHWGWLFVAGKSWRLEAGEEQSFEVLVPGPYTLEGKVPVVLDGSHLEPGAALELTAGAHRISAARQGGQVALRWGDHIFRPAEQPPIKRLFRNF